MDRRGAWSFFGPAAGGWAFLVFTIFHAEGVQGFKPFLNLEAFLLVAGGTLLCLGVSFPMGEVWRAVTGSAGARPAGDEEEARRWGEILRHGADSAVGMGGVATLLGMILMLASIDDVSGVPRRMALALTAMFYGLTLSEAFFVPLARRVRGPDLTLRLPPPGGGQRRLLVGLSSCGSAVLSFFVILYALSAAVAKDYREPEFIKPPPETIDIRLPFISLQCEKNPISRAEVEASGRWLHWAWLADFKSAAYARTFSVGEEFVLEAGEGRGSRCRVRPPPR